MEDIDRLVAEIQFFYGVERVKECLAAMTPEERRNLDEHLDRFEKALEQALDETDMHAPEHRQGGTNAFDTTWLDRKCDGRPLGTVPRWKRPDGGGREDGDPDSI